jgi:hypothetical protein
MRKLRTRGLLRQGLNMQGIIPSTAGNVKESVNHMSVSTLRMTIIMRMNRIKSDTSITNIMSLQLTIV